MYVAGVDKDYHPIIVIKLANMIAKEWTDKTFGSQIYGLVDYVNNIVDAIDRDRKCVWLYDLKGVSWSKNWNLKLVKVIIKTF